MLRFTLHRPSQNSAVSTCCHAMACRDVFGRVHVGVALFPQATHTNLAWLLRLPAAMCLQALQVCDVYAAFTFSTRPGTFCSNRVTSRPQPDLRMPRLRPVFCATLLPGFSMGPRAV